MDCALWLNKKKIYSADEIADNFDIAAIRGYFLGGSLIKWLSSHGGEELARELSNVLPDEPCLNDRLSGIFLKKKCDVPVHRTDENVVAAVERFKSVAAPQSPVVSSFSGSYPVSSYTGSFPFGSFGFSITAANGSFGYGSYSLGSFKRGSFSNAWQWEWYLGSFRKGSFRYGNTSFGGSYVYNFGSYRSGSFNYGSFNYGSFGYGSYHYGKGSFRFGGPFAFGEALLFGSYRGFPFSGGSFRCISSDEYDEIMYRTLGMCPLNRFGYGIHLI